MTDVRDLTCCPNESCSHYGEARTVKGGCEHCGTALEPYHTEPSNRQLAHFASILIHGPGIGSLPSLVQMQQSLFERIPEYRAAWLERHRKMQSLARNLNPHERLPRRVPRQRR